MSLGSQLHESLRQYSDTLQDGSARELVDKDVTQLRRIGVDGVAAQDDAAAEILDRLYGAVRTPAIAEAIAVEKEAQE